MVNVKARELTRMLLDPLAGDLDLVVCHRLSLLLQDRNNIGRRTGSDRNQQHLNGRRRSFSIAFGVNYLSVSAGRNADEKLVAAMIDGCLISSYRHRMYPLRSLNGVRGFYHNARPPRQNGP
jgi:hypothetical protein